jgi:hypothetical protein
MGTQVSARGRDLGCRPGAVHAVPGVPTELRRIIYTTNSIESLNYQRRKIIKSRGHFALFVAEV